MKQLDSAHLFSHPSVQMSIRTTGRCHLAPTSSCLTVPKVTKAVPCYLQQTELVFFHSEVITHIIPFKYQGF